MMSLCSRSNFPTGTAKVLNIQQLVASMTLAKIARPVTVKIYNSSGGSGSGVIINRQDNTYTVLTAHCVVNNADVKYSIHTHSGNDYAVTQVIQFQHDASKPYIALVQFDTSDAYPVANLGNSDEASIGTTIYASGYPQTIGIQTWEFDFTNGIIIGRPKAGLLRYNAPNWSGMNGAPVFNANGQVIAIHVARKVDPESGAVMQLAISSNSLCPLLQPLQAVQDRALVFNSNNI